MKTLCLHLILFCLLGHAVHAQPVSGQPAPSISLRFMGWEKAVANLFLSHNERDYTQITAPAYQWGPDYTTPANTASLKLYHMVEKDGVKTYAVAAEAPLEKDCLDFQVAIVRQGGDTPYRLIPLPNDIRIFQAGKIRVFNFSPYPAAVKLSEKNLQLSPLEWQMVPVSPDKKYRVVMLSALQVDGNWTRSAHEILSLRPEYRGDVMIVHSNTRVGLAPGLSSENTNLAQTIMETEYVSPRMKGELLQSPVN